MSRASHTLAGVLHRGVTRLDHMLDSTRFLFPELRCR